MRTVEADEFEANCLQFVDEVAESGEALIIARNGRPVARLDPVPSRPKTLFGLHEGQVEIVGDIIEPIDVEWEVLR